MVSVKTNSSKLSFETFYDEVQQNLHMNLFNKENNACPNINYKVLEKIIMKSFTSKTVKLKKTFQM